MDIREFEDLYKVYYPKVYGYLYRKIADCFAAEDMAQEIFAVCYQKFDTYNPQKAKLSTWLFAITDNRLKNYYRDKKDYQSLDGEEPPMEWPGNGYVEEAILLEEQKRILAEAMEQLPLRERLIVRKKYFGNLSSKEIAAEMKITDTNARVILNRALHKIYEYFRSSGYEV